MKWLLILLILAACSQEVNMKITSPAFKEDSSIPSKFTCDAENINPALDISGFPEETQSLVLILDDPDIPASVKASMGIDVYDHWVVFNIPPTKIIFEGQEPEGVQGVNSAGKLGYTGPCPPDKEHRYFFKVYALDTKLDLPEGSTKAEVEAAMKGHVLTKGELIGRYNRKENV